MGRQWVASFFLIGRSDQFQLRQLSLKVTLKSCPDPRDIIPVDDPVAVTPVYMPIAQDNVFQAPKVIDISLQLALAHVKGHADFPLAKAVGVMMISAHGFHIIFQPLVKLSQAAIQFIYL